MSELYQRKYNNGIVGEVFKARFGFYRWNCYIPGKKAPFLRGIKSSAFKAMQKCHWACVQSSNLGVAEWQVL